jgi:hypothetical protein
MNIRNGRMKVRPLAPPIFINKITDSPRAAKNDSATDAIRYSGAISDRITRQSRSPMTTIATGTTRARSLSEIALMS